MKKWVMLNQTTGSKRKVTRKKIIDVLLQNRGIIKEEEINRFLNPSLSDLTLENAGLDKKEMAKAAARIVKAIKNKESIVVYTDYDVDGITSGAIVWETLYRLGAKVMPHVPHRVREGYGLSKEGINLIRKKYKPTLVITVDHGIGAEKEIVTLSRLGIETIILDHHLLPKRLPHAFAIIHTTRLSSGGIAWFFANFLLRKKLIQNLDLAALATIADLMPLMGLNRTIVKYGLENLNKTERLGLSSLIKESGLEKREIGVWEVGHILAPRINAVGRLKEAIDALRLLCTTNKERALKLAKILGEVNRQRQLLTEESVNIAVEMIKKEFSSDSKLLFVGHNLFNEGVIGLIAGKLVEEYHRPSIVISLGERYSKASARSILGVNIVEIIREASDFLENVGGHPMAAGFTIATKNISVFKKRLGEIILKYIDAEKLERRLNIDMALGLGEIDDSLYEEINKLAPFGVGNPEPTFASHNVKVLGAKQVGREKNHLKLLLPDDLLAIGFGMGDFYYKLNKEIPIDIVYTLDEDDWTGKKLQLRLKDVRISRML